ncbi:MAG: hypothetical protein U0350_04985 [Caldilineaceae bacterium]
MNTVTTLELPTALYTELVELADAEQTDPLTVLKELISEARQQRGLGQIWEELCDQVERDGGLHAGNTTDEIVEHMRKIREEIFEAEYAHLYR